jgi:hypothetical protein
MFLASLDDSVRRYEQLLQGASGNDLALPNENFDTGRLTRLGDYHLADDTYAKLLEHFDGHLDMVSDAMRSNIVSFYGSAGRPASDKAVAVLAALRQLPRVNSAATN